MKVEIARSSAIVRSPRVKQLEGLFDIAPAERGDLKWSVDLPLEDRQDWNVGLIVGPSGCGKSTIARELFPEAYVKGFDWPADRSIIDAFPESMSIKDVTLLLSSVGFSSPPSWMRPFAVLSNGEQFRATLARALAEHAALCVFDEFTSVVDRTVGKIGSAAVAKTVRRRGQKFIAVTCHDDVAESVFARVARGLLVGRSCSQRIAASGRAESIKSQRRIDRLTLILLESPQ